MSDKPYLSGHYAPMALESTAWGLTVHGVLPPEKIAPIGAGRMPGEAVFVPVDGGGGEYTTGSAGGGEDDGYLHRQRWPPGTRRRPARRSAPIWSQR